MRSFSDKEKAIINKLISIKRNSKLEELQVQDYCENNCLVLQLNGLLNLKSYHYIIMKVRN